MCGLIVQSVCGLRVQCVWTEVTESVKIEGTVYVWTESTGSVLIEGTECLWTGVTLCVWTDST